MSAAERAQTLICDARNHRSPDASAAMRSRAYRRHRSVFMGPGLCLRRIREWVRSWSRFNESWRQGIQTSGSSNAARAAFDAALLPITPGMAAQVEISEADASSIRGIDDPPNGRRSVVSYVLSPIARASGEAGRER